MRKDLRNASRAYWVLRPDNSFATPGSEFVIMVCKTEALYPKLIQLFSTAGCCQDGDSCCSKTGDCCPFAPHTAECCSCEIHALNLVLDEFLTLCRTLHSWWMLSPRVSSRCSSRTQERLGAQIYYFREYCAEDSAGNVGCCPNGEVCSGGGGLGGGGGGGGGGGSGKTTTHKTTHTTPPPTSGKF